MTKKEKKSRKGCRGCLITLVVLIAIPLLLVALLPSILSSDGMRRMIVGKINQSGAGDLVIDSWSISWRKGMSARGIEFKTADGIADIKVESISAPVSVLALMRPTKDLGHIELIKPRIHVVPPSTPPTTSAAEGTGTGTAPAASKAKPPAKTGPRDLGFDLKCQFDLRDGEISVTSPGAAEPLLIHELNISATVPSLNEQSSVSITCKFGKDGGNLDVQGKATLCKDNVLDPEAIVAELAATLESLNLAPLSALAPPNAGAPSVSGLVAFDIALKMAGIANIDATGSVDLDSLAMAGEALAGDTPEFDKISLGFVATRSGADIEVKSFHLESPIANANASGMFQIPGGAAVPEGAFTCNAEVDLPAVASRFRNTMQLREGMDLTRGSIKLAGKIDSAGGSQTATVNLTVGDIAGQFNGRRVELDKPIKLAVAATVKDNSPHLDNLSLESSFVQAQGKGSMDKMSFSLTADLADALREAEKFVELPPGLKLRGKAKMECNAGMTTSKVVTVSNVDIAIDSLFLEQEGKRFSENAIRVALSGIRADLEAKSASIDKLAVSFSPGGINISGVDVPDWTTAPAGVKAHVDGSIDVGELMAMLDDFAAMKDDTSVDAQIVLNGDAVDGKLKSLALDVTSLKFKQGDKKLTEDKIGVTILGVAADPATRRASLDKCSVSFSAGAVNVSDVVVPDWTDALAGVKAHIDGNMDIAKLMTVLGDFAGLQEGTSVEGNVLLKGDIASTSTKQTIDLSAQIKDLVIKAPEQPPIEEDLVDLAVTAEIALADARGVLKTCKLSCKPLNFTATGSLSEWNTEKLLSAKGELALDLELIASIVKALSGMDIVMVGKRPAPFSIETSLKDKDWRAILKETTLAAGLYVEKLEIFGVKVADLTPQLSADGGVLKTPISATVNDGKLNIAPTIDVTGETPMLTMPDDSHVMVDVGLDEAIVNELLARIHPVFKGLMAMKGKVSIDLASVSVPLDDTLMTDTAFNGEVTLSDLSFKSAGLLDLIMILASANTNTLAMDDNSFTFECRKGRIYPQPLKVRFTGHDQYEFTFSGSVGMDKTLDYYVDVPVTYEMVGKDIYATMKGEQIRIPIGGTIDKPKLADDVFKKVLGDIMKKAATRVIKREAEKAIEKAAGDLLKGLFK